MSQRQLHDQIRRAFSALTRPPRPQLTQRIRATLWGHPAPAAGGGAVGFRAPATIALAALVLVAVVAAAVLEGPVVVRTIAHAGSGLASGVSRTLAPPRGASTPTSRATPTPTPATSAPAATPTPGPSPSPSATPTPAPAPSAPPAAAAPPATLPGFSCAAQSGGGGQSAMTTARVGAQSGYDRFVIQFDGPVPQFEVTPQDSAAFAQSGGAVTLQGAAGLSVVLRNASGPAYGGSRDMRPGFSVIQEARLLSDFQGVVEWGIGIARPACFHAWTLGAPSRLVIDVATDP
ncbi:MAG TPA: hypothetical protein VOB72_03960 [Candidatus Dormibacteraeota bacterium]|nr:hypothetical protein [Candidatus Dormibacteraeota bacterium]